MSQSSFSYPQSLLAALALAVSACSGPPVPGGGAPPVNGVFSPRLLSIAAEYVSYGRVDDELRWAPFLCRQPLPGTARQSTSSDDATHGQKLFSVFAKNHDAYPMGSNDGQVIVKQSFKPELVTDPSFKFNPGSIMSTMVNADHFYPYAQKDGKVYRAGAPAGIFVMYKLDAKTADTDAGWVYGSVGADNTVTSAGRIDTCMSCHQYAPHERLFGVN